MNRLIFLDSTPLGLLTQRLCRQDALECQRWFEAHCLAGDRFFVPEIIDYELRRELLRAKKTSSVRYLDLFLGSLPGGVLAVTSVAMRRAAELWADVRNRGLPTCDPRELDVDVILAAQVVTAGLPLNDVVIATSNPNHLNRFVTAELWSAI